MLEQISPLLATGFDKILLLLCCFTDVYLRHSFEKTLLSMAIFDKKLNSSFQNFNSVNATNSAKILYLIVHKKVTFNQRQWCLLTYS